MRKLIIFLGILLFTSTIYGQENKFKIGLTFSSLWRTEIFSLYGSEAIPEVSGKEFYTVGLTGLYSINKNLALETGFLYGRYKIQVVPWGPDRSGYSQFVSLIDLPVLIRVTFLKHFFANGGILFDFDIGDPVELTSQTGLGMTLGTGFNCKIHERIDININPYITAHSMIYSKGFGVTLNDKIIELALRIGLIYRL